MISNPQPLTFKISRALKDITEEDWNSLFGNEAIENYGYQKVLEESGLKEFAFGYLIASRGSKPVLILPFFVMDFSLACLTQGLLQKLTSKFKSALSMKLLFFGTPTAEEFYLGASDNEDISALLDGALKTIYRFCKDEKIRAMLFNNLSGRQAAVAAYLKKRKFIRLETLPTTEIKINAASLEEYISRLSPNMRKDLKRKLNRSSREASLSTVIRDDIDGISEEIYRLYLNNFEGSGVHFEMLTHDFFVNICRRMPGVAKYFLTYDNGRIVAFNLCLVKGDTLIDKFIGFDPAVAHKYHLYFTTFCHNIDFCIKNNIRFYQPGTTDYHPKIRLGAKLLPLDIWAKAPNFILHQLLRFISPLVQPKNLDPSLKNIEKMKKKVTAG
jgi:predicted N-acyltransferase